MTCAKLLQAQQQNIIFDVLIFLLVMVLLITNIMQFYDIEGHINVASLVGMLGKFLVSEVILSEILYGNKSLSNMMFHFSFSQNILNNE
jgi:hypothetical protein